MDFHHVLITGGAGFVGSNLALRCKQAVPHASVTALDSLKRRGSELNLARLRAGGVEFIHGDVRCPEDFDGAPDFDLLIDCSAEPSVQAGTGGSPRYVLQTNLVGTVNCLEAARVRGAAFLLLSTSRVYPIEALNAIPFHETATRFSWDPPAEAPGICEQGVAEEFPLDGARSFYGASKLASELLVREYVHGYGMKALIDRCGILTGPWQMGKVDQGVFTLWVARHHFGKPLKYIGFGGAGKQVRDVLHVDDLFDLLLLQMGKRSEWDGRVYNVGGGAEGSVSLLELTDVCRTVTGKQIETSSEPETSDVDLRVYVTDSRKARRDFGWRPTRGVERIARDIHHWIEVNEDSLAPILG